jgi:hypothetical protein
VALPCRRIAKQTIEFLLGNAVALAGAAQQGAAIDDGDVAVFVADEAGPLQGAGRRTRLCLFNERGNYNVR